MIWSSEGNFGKFESFVEFQIMHIQAFKKSIIHSIFKKTKIIPYNHKVVFLQFHALLSSTWVITLLLSNSTNKISLVYITTPYHLYKIKNLAIILINSIKKD